MPPRICHRSRPRRRSAQRVAPVPERVRLLALLDPPEVVGQVAVPMQVFELLQAIEAATLERFLRESEGAKTVDHFANALLDRPFVDETGQDLPDLVEADLVVPGVHPPLLDLSIADEPFLVQLWVLREKAKLTP